VFGVIVLFLGVAIAPSINADVKQNSIPTASILRTKYFQQGKLLHSYESKNSLENMEQLEQIIVEMDTAFKEKDAKKIKSCITSLKDNHFIDVSLYKSCLNLLGKSSKIYNNEKIEDYYCIVFAYSNNSYNFYCIEIIVGLILGQIYSKLKAIGFSGDLASKVFNLLYNHILTCLVRLIFIKPILPIAYLCIYNGFFYSLGPNGLGYMNTDNKDIWGLIGPFSGIIIDFITPDEEYLYKTKFLFVFGISGVVYVDEIIYFP
jgi:hypothetical protein